MASETHSIVMKSTNANICCPLRFESTSTDAEQLWDTQSDERRFKHTHCGHCRNCNRWGSGLHSSTHHLPLHALPNNKHLYNTKTNLWMLLQTDCFLCQLSTQISLWFYVVRDAILKHTYLPRLDGAQMIDIAMSISAVAIVWKAVPLDIGFMQWNNALTISAWLTFKLEWYHTQALLFYAWHVSNNPDS